MQPQPTGGPAASRPQHALPANEALTPPPVPRAQPIGSPSCSPSRLKEAECRLLKASVYAGRVSELEASTATAFSSLSVSRSPTPQCSPESPAASNVPHEPTLNKTPPPQLNHNEKIRLARIFGRSQRGISPTEPSARTTELTSKKELTAAEDGRLTAAEDEWLREETSEQQQQQQQRGWETSASATADKWEDRDGTGAGMVPVKAANSQVVCYTTARKVHSPLCRTHCFLPL